MKQICTTVFVTMTIGCTETPMPVFEVSSLQSTSNQVTSVVTVPGSWKHFLQHLPVKEGAVVDYRGVPVKDQSKHVAVIDYDIGKTDLQQCADAIMRLRAEFLFSQNRHEEIGFHFTSGDLFSWKDYCAGSRPEVHGSKVQFVRTRPCKKTHENLRRYLDIVYAYAGTISLYTELKGTDRFGIGTVIITPGSPGHCAVIIDEAVTKDGKHVYKLAEGYSPAQSIYVLSNPYNRKLSPWYQLDRGVIYTSSYRFSSYKLGEFE